MVLCYESLNWEGITTNLKKKLLKLTHGAIENLNRPITSKKIELVITKLPTKKRPETDNFISELYWIFKEELTRVFHIFFQKDRGTLLDSFHEAIITLIPK